MFYGIRLEMSGVYLIFTPASQNVSLTNDRLLEARILSRSRSILLPARWYQRQGRNQLGRRKRKFCDLILY